MPNPSFKVKLYSSFGKLLRKIDQNRIMRRYETVASKSSSADSHYLLVPIRKSKGKAIEMPSDWFSSGIRMSFADTESSVPVGYDSILRLVYGDYMCLPPEDQRKPGHAALFFIDDDYIKL